MKTYITCLLLVVFAVAVLANSHEHNPEMQKSIDDCNQQNGVNAQEFQDFLVGKTHGEMVKDNLRCSLHCMLVKSGFMDDAGKLDENAMKSKLMEMDNKQHIVEALDKCKNIVGPTACDTAYMVTACLLENNIKMQ